LAYPEQLKEGEIMYRPPDWVEYYRQWQQKRKEVTAPMSPRVNFEAGADAMLEGLRMDTSKVETVFYSKEKKGYLVFIPEEESK